MLDDKIDVMKSLKTLKPAVVRGMQANIEKIAYQLQYGFRSNPLKPDAFDVIITNLGENVRDLHLVSAKPEEQERAEDVGQQLWWHQVRFSHT